MALRSDFVTKTSSPTGTEIQHYYANGTSGNDENDGLSSTSAKKTLDAVFDLFPDLVTNYVCVNLAGVFTDTVFPAKRTDGIGVILVDGGDTVEVLESFTSDTAGSDNIGLSTKNWIVDQWAGYVVEITSGSADGEFRMIESNTATTLTVNGRLFQPAPSSGDTCQIIRPSTEIQGVILPVTGSNMEFQRLYFSGTGYIRATTCTKVSFSHCISDSTSRFNYWVDNTEVAIYNRARRDPSDFSFIATTIHAVGCSARNPLSQVRAVHSGFSISLGCYFRNAYFHGIRVISSYLFLNCRIKGQVTFEDIGKGFYSERVDNVSGFLFGSLLVDNSPDVGIKFINCHVSIYNVDVDDCTSHGIELIKSRISQRGVLWGSNNGGAGVYAHEGSHLQLQLNQSTTITGTIGNLTIDGTTASSTWATILAGTPVEDSGEMTRVSVTRDLWDFENDWRYNPSTTTSLFEAASTATRSSVAQQTNEDSAPNQVEEVAADAFRFTPDGILVEPDASTNEISNSHRFDLWDGNGSAAVVADDAEGPKGDTDADKITVGPGGTSTDRLRLINTLTGDTNLDYAPSFWIKRISTSGTLGILQATFGSSQGNWSVDLSALPDAWVRIDRSSPYVTVTTEFNTSDNAGNGSAGMHFYSTSTISFHAWGAQAELNGLQAFDTIVSVGGTFTKTAEILRYVGSDLIPVTTGRLHARVKVTDYLDGGDAYVCSLNDGGAETSRIEVRIKRTADGGQAACQIKDTTLQVDIAGTTDLTDGALHTIELEWTTNNVNLIVDGSSEATDVSCTIPTSLDRIEVGGDYANAGRPITIAYLRVGEQ